MRLARRIRLLFGCLLVIAFVGMLFVRLNYTMSRVHSQSAKLRADTYAVGTEYSGTVLKQYINEGSAVTAGQELFVIQSTVLASDLLTQQVSKSGLAFQLDANNNIILVANEDGVVTNIAYLQGSFVPANKEIATIAKANSLYIEATLQLTPSDYSRIRSGNVVDVTFPDNSKRPAYVFYVATVSNADTVQTVIRARLQNSGNLQRNFTIDTPASATLHLTGETLIEQIKDGFNRLVQPRG
jgi:multidrug resistance efflux pump